MSSNLLTKFWAFFRVTKRQKRAKQMAAIDGSNFSERTLEPLGMPLDGPDRAGFVEQCFDGSVGRPLCGQKILSRTICGLMVSAVDDASGIAEVPKRGRGRVYGVKPVDAADGVMAGQILHQRAAKEHIDDLQSPADTENGLFPAEKVIQQRKFFAVPLRIKVAAGVVALTIAAGIQIPASR